MALGVQKLIDIYRSGENDCEESPAPRSQEKSQKKSQPKFLFQNEIGSEVEVPSALGDFSVDPIFIPSKGRYSQSNYGTHILLAAAGIPFTLVVEPNEAQQYGDLLMSLSGYNADIHKVAILSKCNQGISFVRNAILRKFSPDGWFWVMDDDIRSFSRGMGGKNHTVSPEQLFSMLSQRFKKYPNVSVFSLEYEQFSYSYKEGDVAVNSYNNIAIRINKRDVEDKIEYRFSIREDYDFTLQLILDGKQTLRFRDLSFRVPKMCACSGGMTDFYNERKAEIRLQNKKFLEFWPSISREVIKGSNKDIRYDIRVLWVRLNPSKGDPVAVLNSKIPLPEIEMKVPIPRAQRLKPESKKVTKKRSHGVKRARSLSSESIHHSSSESFHSGSFEDDGSIESDASSDDSDSSLSDSFDMAEYEAKLKPLKSKEAVPKETKPIPKAQKSLPKAPAPKLTKHSAPKVSAQTIDNFFKNAPKKTQLSTPKSAPNWKGYVVEWFRELNTETAVLCGLKSLSPQFVSVGDSVLIVPSKLTVTPSVIEGTVIDKWVNKSQGGFGFSVAPSRKYRGVDIQHCATVYNQIDEGVALELIQQVVDEYVEPPKDSTTKVTTENLKAIEDLLKK